MSKKSNTKKAIVNLFILDASSSMTSIKQQIIEGFNEQVDRIITLSQKSDIKSFAGLTTFSTTVDIKFTAEDVDNLYKLDDYNYNTMGATAMNDAIALSVKALDEKLGGLMDACNVVVTVLTDGEENASRQYCSTQIADIIEEYREQYGWTFTFIGANIDVEELASRMNISRGNTLSFSSTAEGTRNMMRSYSNSMESYYSSAASGEDVSDTQCFMSEDAK